MDLHRHLTDSRTSSTGTWRRLASGAVGLSLLLVAAPSPIALAATTTNLTVNGACDSLASACAANSVAPGASFSITATFTLDAEPADHIFVVLSSMGLAPGTVSLGTPTLTGVSCSTSTSDQIRCVYIAPTVPSSGTIQVTATVSETATVGGVITAHAGSELNGEVQSQTQDIVVVAPQTTTDAPATTTDAPATTTAPTGALPSTGSATGHLALAALAALVVGAGFVLVTRRRHPLDASA